jgi:hypothetical protein
VQQRGGGCPRLQCAVSLACGRDTDDRHPMGDAHVVMLEQALEDWHQLWQVRGLLKRSPPDFALQPRCRHQSICCNRSASIRSSAWWRWRQNTLRRILTQHAQHRLQHDWRLLDSQMDSQGPSAAAQHAIIGAVSIAMSWGNISEQPSTQRHVGQMQCNRTHLKQLQRLQPAIPAGHQLRFVRLRPFLSWRAAIPCCIPCASAT